jgi:hypothetical protein
VICSILLDYITVVQRCYNTIAFCLKKSRDLLDSTTLHHVMQCCYNTITFYLITNSDLLTHRSSPHNGSRRTQGDSTTANLKSSSKGDLTWEAGFASGEDEVEEPPAPISGDGGGVELGGEADEVHLGVVHHGRAPFD